MACDVGVSEHIKGPVVDGQGARPIVAWTGPGPALPYPQMLEALKVADVDDPRSAMAEMSYQAQIETEPAMVIGAAA